MSISITFIATILLVINYTPSYTIPYDPNIINLTFLLIINNNLKINKLLCTYAHFFCNLIIIIKFIFIISQYVITRLYLYWNWSNFFRSIIISGWECNTITRLFLGQHRWFSRLFVNHEIIIFIVWFQCFRFKRLYV